MAHTRLNPERYSTAGDVRCDGWCDNVHDGITHIDESGFAYCAPCGRIRQDSKWKRCRKLRPHELQRILRGQQLAHY